MTTSHHTTPPDAIETYRCPECGRPAKFELWDDERCGNVRCERHKPAVPCDFIARYELVVPLANPNTTEDA